MLDGEGVGSGAGALGEPGGGGELGGVEVGDGVGAAVGVLGVGELMPDEAAFPPQPASIPSKADM